MERWPQWKALSRRGVKRLVIGAQHDTMDPAHMGWMSQQIRGAEFLLCENGSHLAMYDDQQVYMAGLVAWLKKVERLR